MTLPGMGDWDWDAEIVQARRAKQQVELAKVSDNVQIFVKRDRVYLEEKYFTELCKQMKHRVGVVVETFPHADGFYSITPQGYLHLQKYLPLPAWETLKILKG